MEDFAREKDAVFKGQGTQFAQLYLSYLLLRWAKYCIANK